ncbi:MAG: hypothetical protein JWM40_1537 [Frankiales bacterium]|nr:hypothetical protein [Frankiales bacterium]
MRRLWVLLLLPIGLLVLAPTAQAACTTPELPVVGCPLPGPADTPSPTPAPAPTSESGPTAEPTAEATAEPTAGELVTVTTTDPPPPGAVFVGGVLTASPTPDAAPPPAAAPVVDKAAAAPLVVASPLPGVVASSFAIVVFGLLAIPILLSFLAGLRPAGSSPPYGGHVMRDRTRLWTGLGVLAAAAVVGGIGWYRVSGEPLLNRQIPFLASAGIVVVLLSVLGGSLIIAEQLRGDQNRIGDLEEAVRALTEALAPSIESPPRVEQPATEVLVRGRARSRRASSGST